MCDERVLLLILILSGQDIDSLLISLVNIIILSLQSQMSGSDELQ